VEKQGKIIVILGQTSTGKSDFAVDISKALAVSRVESEIISADSRQVYKGMDLGTGKIAKKEMYGVPHHLLDVASPKRIFSVSDFQKLANKKIEEILARGNIPIICGGTGFYIDSVVNGTTFPEVPPNQKLRDQLTMKSTTVLYNVLKKLNPERAKTIDKNNKVRLIRAIEIAKFINKKPKSPKKPLFPTSPTCGKYKFLKIGLVIPDEILKKRIYDRLISRLKQGMLEEVERLHKQGVSWKRMHQLGLEYRYCALYLQGLSRRAKAGKIPPPASPCEALRASKEEMAEQINKKTWQYAKRQKTWWKRDKDIIWIDPRKKSEKSKTTKEIQKFLE